MHQAVIAKLQFHASLSDADRAFIEDVLRVRRKVEAGTELLRSGEPTAGTMVLLDGLALRYKLLPDGKRQIVGTMIAGDFGDLFGYLVDTCAHSLLARTDCQLVHLTGEDVAAMMARPALAAALGRINAVDAAILREWLVNVGRRNAERRVAHLLCELYLRLRVIGRASTNGFALPLTQGELADTVGLTIVSVNRAIQHLKRSGLIRTDGRDIAVPDLDALMDYAGFDATYLHPHRGGEPLPTRPSPPDIA